MRLLVVLLLLAAWSGTAAAAEAQPIIVPYTTSSWKVVSPAGALKEFAFTAADETLACSFHADVACGLIIYRQRGDAHGYEIKVTGVTDGKTYHDSRTDTSGEPRMVIARIPAGDYLLEVQNRRPQAHAVILSLCKFTIEQMDKMEAEVQAEAERMQKWSEDRDRKAKAQEAEKAKEAKEAGKEKSKETEKAPAIP